MHRCQTYYQAGSAWYVMVVLRNASFIVDNNVPKVIVRLLEELYDSAIWIAKIPTLRNLKNDQLLEYAKERGALLVTCDMDFLRLRETQVKILYIEFEVARRILQDLSTQEIFRRTLRLALEKLLSFENVYIVKVVDVDRVEY